MSESIGYQHSTRYMGIRKRRMVVILAILVSLLCFACYALTIGSIRVDFMGWLSSLARDMEDDKGWQVLWYIRLPRILAAILGGWGLALSGAVMQNLLKNPLASPFTLGISHGAAFGAAVAILFVAGGRVSAGAVVFSSHSPYLVVSFAFLGAFGAAAIVMALSSLRKLGPESLVLAGVAMGSLFSAATMVLQYLANELQVAAILFWTFGDVSRPGWNELSILAMVVFVVFFLLKSMVWDMNVLLLGEDESRALGVDVRRLRFVGMMLVSLLAAVITAFMGVIGFIGLLGPHMAKRLLGEDHSFLLLGSAAIGAALLLISDTVARVIITPLSLPVGTVTSFLGAPLFLYLLLRCKGNGV